MLLTKNELKVKELHIHVPTKTNIITAELKTLDEDIVVSTVYETTLSRSSEREGYNEMTEDTIEDLEIVLC